VYADHCAYRTEWDGAVLEDEISQDLRLSQRQSKLALTILIGAGKVYEPEMRQSPYPRASHKHVFGSENIAFNSIIGYFLMNYVFLSAWKHVVYKKSKGFF
jgi:hypothetical protein